MSLYAAANDSNFEATPFWSHFHQHFTNNFSIQKLYKEYHIFRLTKRDSEYFLTPFKARAGLKAASTVLKLAWTQNKPTKSKFNQAKLVEIFETFSLYAQLWY